MGDSSDGDWMKTIARRLGIEHRHSAGTTALVVVCAVLCGVYASWLLADFGLRWPALVIVVAVGGVGFYARPTRRRVLVSGLYALAGLLAVTPLMFDISFLLAASQYSVADPWPVVLSPASLVAVAVFGLLALIVAGCAYLINRYSGRNEESDA